MQTKQDKASSHVIMGGGFMIFLYNEELFTSLFPY